MRRSGRHSVAHRLKERRTGLDGKGSLAGRRHWNKHGRLPDRTCASPAATGLRTHCSAPDCLLSEARLRRLGSGGSVRAPLARADRKSTVFCACSVFPPVTPCDPGSGPDRGSLGGFGVKQCLRVCVCVCVCTAREALQGSRGGRRPSLCGFWRERRRLSLRAAEGAVDESLLEHGTTAFQPRPDVDKWRRRCRRRTDREGSRLLAALLVRREASTLVPVFLPWRPRGPPCGR